MALRHSSEFKKKKVRLDILQVHYHVSDADKNVNECRGTRASEYSR